MIFITLFVLITHLLLPVWLTVNLLLFDKSASQVELGLAILCCGSYTLFVFLLGNWSWVGYGWRYVFLGLFAIATAKSILSIVTLPLWARPNASQWLNLSIYTVLFTVLMTQSAQALMGRAAPAPSLTLNFPMKK